MLPVNELSKWRGMLAARVARCWTNCNILRILLNAVANVLSSYHAQTSGALNFLRGGMVDPAASEMFRRAAQKHTEMSVSLREDIASGLVWVLDPAIALPSIICMALIIVGALVVLSLSIAKCTLAPQYKWHLTIILSVTVVAALRLSVYALQWKGLRMVSRARTLIGNYILFYFLYFFFICLLLFFTKQGFSR